MFEKSLITQALRECDNNRVRAAKSWNSSKHIYVQVKKAHIGGDNKSKDFA